MFPNQFGGFNPFGMGGGGRGAPWGMNPFAPLPGGGAPWLLQQQQQHMALGFPLQHPSQQPRFAQQVRGQLPFRPRESRGGRGGGPMMATPRPPRPPRPPASPAKDSVLSGPGKSEESSKSSWKCSGCHVAMQQDQCLKCNILRPPAVAASDVQATGGSDSKTTQPAHLQQSSPGQKNNSTATSANVPQQQLLTQSSLEKIPQSSPQEKTGDQGQSRRWQVQAKGELEKSYATAPTSVLGPFQSKTGEMPARNPAKDNRIGGNFRGAGSRWDSATVGNLQGGSGNAKAESVRGKPAYHLDWTCSACKFVNFSRRTCCNKCQRPKTGDSQVGPGSVLPTPKRNLPARSAAATAVSDPNLQRQQEYEQEHLLFQARDPFEQDPSEFDHSMGKPDERGYSKGPSLFPNVRAQQHQELESFHIRSQFRLQQEPPLNNLFENKSQTSQDPGQTFSTRFQEQFGKNTQDQAKKPTLFPSESSHHRDSVSSAVKSSLEHSKLLEKEAEFDKTFEQWESNFAIWKRQNESNPDENFVQNHIYEMDRLRERMISRRETLRQQRYALLAGQQQSSAPLHQNRTDPFGDQSGIISDKKTSGGRDGNRWRSDERDCSPERSRQSWEDDYHLPGGWNGGGSSQQKRFANSANYSKAASSSGIPGLGDGQDTVGQDDSNMEQQLSRKDLEAISRTVRSLERPEFGPLQPEERKRQSQQFSWNQQREGDDNSAQGDGSSSLWLRRSEISRKEDRGNYFDSGSSLNRENSLAGNSFSSGRREFEKDMFERREHDRDTDYWKSRDNSVEYEDVSAPKQPKIIDYGGDQQSKQPKVIEYGHGGGGGGFGPLDETAKFDSRAAAAMSGGSNSGQQPQGSRIPIQPEKRVFDYGTAQSSSGERDFATSSLHKASFDYDTRNQEPAYSREQGQSLAFKFPRPVPSGSAWSQVDNSERNDRNYRNDSQASDRYGQHGASSSAQLFDYSSHQTKMADGGFRDRDRGHDLNSIRGGDLSRVVPPPPPPPPLLIPPTPSVPISDLLEPPGRYIRPPKIVLILRGLPGSGKSTLCKTIKTKECELGSSGPRVLCLDDYFECDGQYEFDADLEASFRTSLVKSFKKQIDDGYFAFMIVDSINDKTKHYEEMWSYAKQRGFEVYIGDLDCDPGLCFSRNIHGRDKNDIERLFKGWEATPSHFSKVDLREIWQRKDPVGPDDDVTSQRRPLQQGAQNDQKEEDQEDEEDNTEDENFKLSKWEKMDNEVKMAKLDGVSEHARKRVAEHDSIEDWLEMSTKKDSAAAIDGKKRVRWADIEEQRAQMKMKAVGFVVGQTNWNRMMDPTQGGSALTQTKIIPNRFDYH